MEYLVLRYDRRILACSKLFCFFFPIFLLAQVSGATRLDVVSDIEFTPGERRRGRKGFQETEVPARPPIAVVIESNHTPDTSKYKCIFARLRSSFLDPTSVDVVAVHCSCEC